ncbi:MULTISPECIES: alpha/beta hydrolase family protein [Niastella]|uniref:S9 family peptidase n=1 Tax=Niastella soli TaxID=2821487 RepID=A0ABS3YXX8_9BACT|nr:prolyl oligopeptidase family serine peptidase [Niastella soli]MBO9202689.1 S9 family peptidase [Niastella soli]
MRKLPCIFFLLLAGLVATAQKKPLTHAVYDGWQSINERYISNNGKWVVYTITPQEGDATLVIQATDNSYRKEIPRGYAAEITDDNRFVICKIRPLFAATREAKIKKKKADEMPKDSLAIVAVGKDSVLRIPRIKSFKTPEKGTGQWLAYLQEKALPVPPIVPQADSTAQLNNLLHMADSLSRVADSLRNKANEAKTKGLATLKAPKKDAKPKAGDPIEEGTELVLRNLYTGEEKKYPLVSDYYFSGPGNTLIIETTRSNADTLKKAAIVWLNTATGKIDTVFRGFNDAKSFGLDEAGTQLAFIAERDSSTKALQKFYKLYYYRTGMDSARMRVDRKSTGIRNGFTVSETAVPEFSKNGQKLFFGLMPVRKPKDTTLVDFETARLDIWHYNDDYLQPQQLVQLNTELQRSYKAVLNGNDDKVIQLGSEDAENITLPDDNNVEYLLATSTKGNRVESQWQGYARTNAYLISTTDGSRKLVKEKQRGFFTMSPAGKYVIWYDGAQKNYFTYSVSTGAIINITKNIKVPLFDEDDDHPDDPPPHGIMKWHENDKYVYLYDKYDIWQCDPEGKKAPSNFTKGEGRLHKNIYRYIQTDKEEKFISDTQTVVFKELNEVSKQTGLKIHSMEGVFFDNGIFGPYQIGLNIIKAKNGNQFVYTKESFNQSPVLTTLYVATEEDTAYEAKKGVERGTVFRDIRSEVALYASNPQQKDYNWLTCELVKWKMFDGKMSEGLLFKPEDFDAKKKYPMIFYFYEKYSDDLYLYRQPAPSASTINIPLFVSNGYLVFVPDISYKKGEPGESAYNSVVSAAKYFTQKPWVDSTKMAIQGQSWGGYQVAYLVTRTNMFAAAEAGAPVSNMTSAYGGIRWGTGINRQFQYERTQSRIGYTLWQRPDLYIKNSPLFNADKVKTPLLITHNDADGAVPWYQGIEYFTALRRLGKKVWLLQYNGEDHNLVERRNRKDLSIRLSQYFDHFLKGAPAPHWLAEGVPATSKGIDWGTELEEKEVGSKR